MKFFKLKENIYPIFSIIASLFTIVFGLCMAKSIKGSYFLIALFIWLLIFGLYKSLIRMTISFIIIGGIFSFIAYFAYGKDLNASMAMANRFGSIFLGLAISMSVEPSKMIRALSTIKMPRALILGALIVTSFPKVLQGEVKRVLEAMKVRGANNILNIKVFYRAFLIPFITRIVNISDTLSLSIETRGFSLRGNKYSVYNNELINIYDLIFLVGIVISAVLVVKL